jgi:hypothetical protein
MSFYDPDNRRSLQEICAEIAELKKTPLAERTLVVAERLRKLQSIADRIRGDQPNRLDTGGRW